MCFAGQRTPPASGDVQLRAVRDHPRAADLEDQLLAELLLLGLERFLQLLEAPLAGTSGSVDQSVSSKARRAASIARCMSAVGRVGDVAEHLLGRRVDVVEGLPGLGVDQLAVDEHPPLALCRHAALLSTVR